MSTASATAATAPSSAPETITAATTAPDAAAARPQVTAPEHTAAAEPAATTIALPPHLPLPTAPTPHSVTPPNLPVPEAANDPLARVADQLEKSLAHYIGGKMASDVPAGAAIHRVVVTPSTPNSTMKQNVTGLLDVGFWVEGVDPQHKDQFIGKLHDTLHLHHALGATDIESVYQATALDGSAVSGMVFCSIRGINTTQITELLTEQPVHKEPPAPKGTPIVALPDTAAAHTCSGAGCSQCGADPSTTLAVPATHIGRAANDRKFEIAG